MADGDCWACSSQCCDWMRDRIQRAVAALATLRAIQRHEVTPYTSRQVSWERTPDGPWVLQRDVEAVVDDLVQVLEGET